jgi:hypothetical protein
VAGVVVAVVVVPVVRTPGAPVVGVVTPVPYRAPGAVNRTCEVNNHRPAGYFIIGGVDNVGLSPDYIATVSGVGCLGILGLDDVVFAVKSFVANQLYHDGTVAFFLNHNNSHVLVLILVECNTHYDVVHIAVLILVVVNHYVIHVTIVVQVEVVDHFFRVIEFSFKGFQGFRLLEDIHHGIEVQVVTRQPEIPFRVGLRRERTSRKQEECEDRGDEIFFHSLRVLKIRFFAY